MERVFDCLAVWIDRVPRDGPRQMACDEVLLARATEPVLRIFRWAAPWVSIGCFVPWPEAAATAPGLPVCRRWTGGGVVVHDGDFTFALTAPRAEPWARSRPAESYRLLHAALAEALRGMGRTAELFADDVRGQAACFAGPVRHDLVDGSRKVAGGAQRRTKRGLLHQGSVRQEGLEAGLTTGLAAALAAGTTPWITPDGFEEEVAALAGAKYAREEFLRRKGP